MASSGLSFVQYVGDGSSRNYVVPFKYIEKSHVTVSVNGTAAAFSWINDSTLQLTSAAASGHIVDVRRVTPSNTRLVNFTNGSSLGEKELDLNSDQVLYIIQEAFDRYTTAAELLEDMVYSAEAVPIRQYTFTGDGTTSEFTLPVTPISAASLLTTIDGAIQTPGTAYTVGGATIAFAEAPDDDSVIVVRVLGYARSTEDVVSASEYAADAESFAEQADNSKTLAETARLAAEAAKLAAETAKTLAQTAKTDAQTAATNAATSATAAANSLTDITTGLAGKISASEKGVANGVATLGSDAKIPQTQLPAIAITDTFVIGSQSAMLALSAQTGDVAVRTDLSKSFILAGTNPATLGHWQEILTPTDAVVSVNGQTGVVVLTAALIGAAALTGATFTGPVRGASTSVAYASNLALDLSTGNDFIVGTLAGALTLANPVNPPSTNQTQGGIIEITQSASGGVTPVLGTQWKALGTPTWNTAANGVTIVNYYYLKSGVVLYTAASRAA